MTRPACRRCGRPTRTCLCATLPPPLAHRTELLILQHPAEAGHAKNTAALLTLGLQRARLLCGEVFDASVAAGGAVLLYPGDGPAPSGPVGQLVLLDGTWRQSRRLLAANPWLAGLPRLSLPPQPGRYALRRAHRPGQLSTLESGLLALTTLEGSPERFAPLWAAFHAFVHAGLSRRGETRLP
ncbi:tRNA-uridine aminocarboxypropyltransferase [Roseateles cellulosilyticus]|uniref:tRNA-uridine aminocarboxypropyltransferase n=1 Tax=Pelomonas cellulosilytica TaxID=2906762 RepID=A0ABS8Y322_9BURK|nr:tRNA-uridine aminocarboxypropyltransferase [Pelomonas sp. P8]MCE4557458.1 DTW domain-containing protein [Pelomonas sp. P8]